MGPPRLSRRIPVEPTPTVRREQREFTSIVVGGQVYNVHNPHRQNLINRLNGNEVSGVERREIEHQLILDRRSEITRPFYGNRVPNFRLLYLQRSEENLEDLLRARGSAEFSCFFFAGERYLIDNHNRQDLIRRFNSELAMAGRRGSSVLNQLLQDQDTRLIRLSNARLSEDRPNRSTRAYIVIRGQVYRLHNRQSLNQIQRINAGGMNQRETYGVEIELIENQNTRIIRVADGREIASDRATRNQLLIWHDQERGISELAMEERFQEMSEIRRRAADARAQREEARRRGGDMAPWSSDPRLNELYRRDERELNRIYEQQREQRRQERARRQREEGSVEWHTGTVSRFGVGTPTLGGERTGRVPEEIGTVEHFVLEGTHYEIQLPPSVREDLNRRAQIGRAREIHDRNGNITLATLSSLARHLDHSGVRIFRIRVRDRGPRFNRTYTDEDRRLVRTQGITLEDLPRYTYTRGEEITQRGDVWNQLMRRIRRP